MLLQPPPPPAPPSPPSPPDPSGASPGPIAGTPRLAGAPSPAEVYRGYQAQREELGNQLERLEDRRQELTGQITETPVHETAIRQGMEKRLAEIDVRISEVEKQIAVADAQVASAAAVPGSVVPDPPPPPREGPPEEVFIIPIVFIIFVLFPLTIAFVRRLWKRPIAGGPVTMPPELTERLGRLEQAVDSVALEVERIGEGQRFVSRLFAEGGVRPLGAGAADPVPVTQGEALGARRGQ